MFDVMIIQANIHTHMYTYLYVYKHISHTYDISFLWKRWYTAYCFIVCFFLNLIHLVALLILEYKRFLLFLLRQNLHIVKCTDLKHTVSGF